MERINSHQLRRGPPWPALGRRWHGSRHGTRREPGGRPRLLAAAAAHPAAQGGAQGIQEAQQAGAACGRAGRRAGRRPVPPGTHLRSRGGSQLIQVQAGGSGGQAGGLLQPGCSQGGTGGKY